MLDVAGFVATQPESDTHVPWEVKDCSTNPKHCGRSALLAASPMAMGVMAPSFAK